MRIVISKKNLELINMLYNKFNNVEVGGVLLGKKIDGDYVITHILYNFEKILLKRFRFKRDINALKDEMKSVIIGSNYEIDYLGEWHTHPNSSSMYSTIDQKSMLELNEYFDELILLIRGKDYLSGYLFTKGSNIRLNIFYKEEEFYG